MPVDAVIEPYFRVYQGEETNPYDEITNMRFKRFWNLEMQWALFKNNEKYIAEALDLYSKEGLDDFCGDDGVPMEFKAYLLCRMVKSPHYVFQTKDFKKYYFGLCYFNRDRFKYYKGETTNPFPKKSVKSNFWYGEMKFVATHQSFYEWETKCEKTISQLEELCDEESLNHLKVYSKTQQIILRYVKHFFDNKGAGNCDNWIWNY